MAGCQECGLPGYSNPALCPVCSGPVSTECPICGLTGNRHFLGCANDTKLVPMKDLPPGTYSATIEQVEEGVIERNEIAPASIKQGPKALSINDPQHEANLAAARLGKPRPVLASRVVKEALEAAAIAERDPFIASCLLAVARSAADETLCYIGRLLK